ncbi:twin-arginine translocation signal domain-containing protein [Pseudonocardia nigra]|uniref:twin-arginine translocation signal domain-containing protein n=1 Tax=Pseudonocardia nigra TaxID=1921578 RepID=UPI001C6025C5
MADQSGHADDGQRNGSGGASGLGRAGRWTRRRFLRLTAGTVAVVTGTVGSIVGFAPKAHALSCYERYNRCYGCDPGQNRCCIDCYVGCKSGGMDAPLCEPWACAGCWVPS